MFTRKEKINYLKNYKKEAVDLSRDSDKGDYKGEEVEFNHSDAKKVGPHGPAKPKIKIKEEKEKDNDLEVSPRGDKHQFGTRSSAEHIYEKPDYSEFEYFEPRTVYFSTYRDKSDITPEDLKLIVAKAKELADPTFDEKWSIDKSAQDNVKWQDALEKAIWSMNQGTYQSKIDYNDYQQMLTMLKEDSLTKTASEKDTNKEEQEVEKVIQSLLDYKEEKIDNANAAWKVLDRDSKYKKLSPSVKKEVLYRFLSRDFGINPEVDGELYPLVPENVKMKKAADVMNILNTINQVEKELILLKVAAKKKKFQGGKTFKKLFDSKKKMSYRDLVYHLNSYGLEEEEANELINTSVQDGSLSRIGIDEYSYKGGYGKELDSLHNKENVLEKEKVKIEAEIAEYQEKIEKKENIIDILEERLSQLRGQIDLTKLNHSDRPEYTKRVFEKEIKDQIHSLTFDGRKRSYKFSFKKVNDQYKPEFELILYNKEGIDTDSLKKAAILFKQRLQRLLDSNLGYLDYDIEGDGKVFKDEENKQAFTKVTMSFDLQLIDPKQIDALKNEIEILIHWLDDHFVL